MGDISCAVCTEPWDAYGARHGDMLPWEYNLFRQGAGCPSCEGEPPEDLDSDDTAEQHIRAAWLSGATDDPDAFTLGFDLDQKRPSWEPPPPTILWTCATCQVSAGYEPDDPSELVWLGGEPLHYLYGNAYVYGSPYTPAEEPTKESEYTIDCPTEGTQHYCPGCAATCQGFEDGPDGCDAVILKMEHTEMYSAGHGRPDVLAGNPFQTGAGFCDDCFERIPNCHRCGEYYDDHDAAMQCCVPECSEAGCWTKVETDDDGDAIGEMCLDCQKEQTETICADCGATIKDGDGWVHPDSDPELGYLWQCKPCVEKEENADG